MNIKDLWVTVCDTVKEKCSPLAVKVKDFVRENKIISICIGALILVILLAFILLISALKKPEAKKYERPVNLTEEMYIPPSPAVPDGYNPSRITKEAWTNEEAEAWFTVPGQKELEDLSRANDRLINEITGAAP